MIENFTKEMLSGEVNTKFRVVDGPTGPVELELEQITEGVTTPTQEQFSLLFRGPLDSFLIQKTYEVEHETVGKFALFLVPVGRQQDGFQYEAVFNRFLRGA